MRAACLQLNSGDDVAANLAAVARLLAQAAEEGVRLAALPENFALMSPDAALKRRAAAYDIPATVLPFLAAQARQHAIYLIGGSVLLAGADGQLRNTCPVFGPDGTCLASYDKIHLFDIDLPTEHFRESELIAAGAAPVSVDLGGWRTGLSICYDLRFPELYRRYAAAGCTLLSVPAAFTVPTGAAHWQVLLRARAIENQAYLLAPAQAGRHPGGRRTWGESLIVDPWGEVVAAGASAPAAGGEALVSADLDPERLRLVRTQLPALSHRRLP